MSEFPPPEPAGRPSARAVTVVLAALSVLSLVIACGTSVRIRDNPFVRKMLYPPPVEGMGAGLGPDTPGDGFDASDLARLLYDTVDPRGRVDYALIAERRAELDGFLARVAKTDRGRLSKHGDLAFLLNAFNAAVITIVLDHPDAATILDVPEESGLGGRRFNIGGKEYTLADLELTVLRPEFRDARIHFAMPKAARGLPHLRREPYVRERLPEQLDAQARAFLAREKIARLEATERKLHLTRLFDRYRDDFEGEGGAVADWVIRYGPEVLSIQVRTVQNGLKIDYFDDDWSLDGTR